MTRQQTAKLKQHTKQTDNTNMKYMLSPFQLLVFSVFGGPLVAGPIGGIHLFFHGHRVSGFFLILNSLSLGTVLIGGAFLIDSPWYWLSLVVLLCHILYGILLFIYAKKTFQPLLPSAGNEGTGNHRHILTGIAGGALFSFLTGALVTGAYLLLVDRFLSTWFPVVFDDSMAIFKCATQVFFLGIAGGLAGGFIGRNYPNLSPGRFFAIILLFFWIEFSWLFFLEIFIGLPAFQAAAATSNGWQAMIIPYVLGNLLVGIWLPVFLLGYIQRAAGFINSCYRTMQVVFINMIFALTLATILGYPADIYLSLGRTFERIGNPEKALWCYKQGLVKKPDNNIASHLQYRVALLDHTLGNTIKAKQGFQRVVAKHSDSEKLVVRAGRFLDNLEQYPEGKRILLPIINTKTEYLGAYCVPNSLALVLQFWGNQVTARSIGSSITGLGTGTFMVNQAWFAEDQGFRHDFLPLATLDDIKLCIDAGFPVLVYVPAHVFAIVGYDDALQTFITYDVATGDIWSEYLQKDFIKSWKRQYTTLVLSYPPDQEKNIPSSIRQRLTRLTDSYLHYNIYGHKSHSKKPALAHLLKATETDGEFFQPVTELYSEYPHERSGVTSSFDQILMQEQINLYFRNDYNEGMHLWGQLHFDEYAEQDESLRYSIDYLIGTDRREKALELLQHINDRSSLSNETLALSGMINLSLGHLETGVDQLRQAEEDDFTLYTGLARLHMGDVGGGVSSLVETLPKWSGYG